MASGSAILGSGGGGNPAYDLLMARYQMEQFGSIRLMDIAELTPDDLVVPIGFMGAPLVGVEKIPQGNEFVHLISALEEKLRKKATVLMPIEIGGGNAFTPMMAAGRLGLPVLDADTLGRAFPELQMSSCNLHRVLPTPAFLTDSLGNTVSIDARDSFALERLARNITIAMGSSSALAMYLMSGDRAASAVVPYSISKAIAIGKTMLYARKQGKDPMPLLLSIYQGLHIGSGKIVDIDQVVSDGFLRGTATILNDAFSIELIYQNEYLLAKRQGKVAASTPDILMLLEQETGTPITSESLQYGLKVNLIALPSPAIWQTPAGLALVGPRYFGYDFDYQPFEGAYAYEQEI